MSKPIEIDVWVCEEKLYSWQVYHGRGPEVWVSKEDAKLSPVDKQGRAVMTIDEELALRKGLI